jgi:hypothetical protein
MGFFVIAAILAMFADFKMTKGNNKKSYKREYRRRRTSYRKDNSWQDAAWFHDHGQRI